jgi:hypothetical protein
VKLAELVDLDHRDREPLGEGLPGQLAGAGLEELASYITTDEADRLVAFVATDAGLYVGRMIEEGELKGHIQGKLVPWRQVAGAGLAMAGYEGRYDSLTVSITSPVFHASASAKDQALLDFGTTCLRRAG